MNKVDFKLKVLRQEQRLNEKKEQTSVKLSCFMSGKKTSDGYEEGIFFDVIVLPSTMSNLGSPEPTVQCLRATIPVSESQFLL